MQWVWNDKFSSSEKQKLIEWIEHSFSGMETLYGELPYQYKVYFYRKTDGNGPVPWANTDKRSTPSAHFHVNMKYSMDVFNRDWTAPHELAHLLFPYLGKSGTWFSEGIASYLQYQIMYANNTRTWKQVIYKLNERFNAAERYRQYNDISVLELNDIVFQAGAFVRLYWSGAAYFLSVDKQLYEEKNMRLNDVIKKYLRCCYNNNINNYSEMITLFDNLSDSKIFTENYDRYINRVSTLDTDTHMKWLAMHPPALK